MSVIPWAGNERERAVKKRGFGFYASHIGSMVNAGTEANYYMRRFILLLPFGFTLRLHHIVRSDDDRHLHDHPFSFASFLLSGGYFETVPCEPVEPLDNGKRTEYRRRFSFNVKRATDQHALALTRPVWTLVFAMPKSREWGFHTEMGWVHNEDYFHLFQQRGGPWAPDVKPEVRA